MADFQPFAALVHKRFTQLSKNELFEVDIAPDKLWEMYLQAFPEGTNPKFRVNTEHDCSCCRHFVRGLGNVVSVVNGQVQSVWGVKGLEEPYQTVADTLNAAVLAVPLSKLYRTTPKEAKYGAVSTKELREGGHVHTWNHFHGVVAAAHICASPGAVVGDHAASVQVLRRGLEELKPDAFDTVLGLIDQKALYRGEEHLKNIGLFMAAQAKYLSLGPKERELFLFTTANDKSVSRFRNTVIGTLLTDLSEGKPLEDSVRSFEAMVAPANYKRPKALITPRMVEDAMKTINELGIEPSLKRRFATMKDVSVNNVLWADGRAKAQMKGALESMLLEAAVEQTAKVDLKNAEKISIDDFMAKVVPKAVSMSLHLRGSQQANFMSLTAPQDPSAPNLFKWDNQFGWSYDGNVTDSIKEKVKAAGGQVEVPLRVSLAWSNYDDLDLHAYCPDGHVYYGQKRGGNYGSSAVNILDVDMNAGGPRSREPVENLSWAAPKDGHYSIEVNQYNQRETTDVGFTLQLVANGSVQQFSYTPAVKGAIPCLSFDYKGGEVLNLKVHRDLVGGGIPQEKWGVQTETFVPVSTLMYSPNHWDGQSVGNRHWFFTLEGCVNPMPTRGIYNEFLKGELDKHRQVFEVLGDRTKCPSTQEQLSGVGFSSTRNDSVTVLVKEDKAQRLYNVIF